MAAEIQTFDDVQQDGAEETDATAEDASLEEMLQRCLQQFRQREFRDHLHPVDLNLVLVHGEKN